MVDVVEGGGKSGLRSCLAKKAGRQLSRPNPGKTEWEYQTWGDQHAIGADADAFTFLGIHSSAAERHIGLPHSLH